MMNPRDIAGNRDSQKVDKDEIDDHNIVTNLPF